MIMPSGSNFDYFMTAARESEESFSTNLCNLLRYYSTLAECDGHTNGGELDYLVGLVCQGPHTSKGKSWLARWPDGYLSDHREASCEIAAAAGACLQAGWVDRFNQILAAKPDSTEDGMNCDDYDSFLVHIDRYQFGELEQG